MLGIGVGGRVKKSWQRVLIRVTSIKGAEGLVIERERVKQIMDESGWGSKCCGYIKGNEVIKI